MLVEVLGKVAQYQELSRSLNFFRCWSLLGTATRGPIQVRASCRVVSKFQRH